MIACFRLIVKVVASTIVALLALVAPGAIYAQDSDGNSDGSHPIKVSLITFYPGDEIFEVFGHTEILVTDSTGSYYVNYGVFDFNSPNFLGRYIKGETDYICAIMPPELDGGLKSGRKIVKQDLNLTPEQAQQVWDILVQNLMPDNRVYRYRHFSDNCSTRPRDVIETALGTELDYSDCDYLVGNTLRQVMSHYTRNYPWEQFGIDLALGAVCDTIIDARTQTFVPLFLMHALESVEVDDEPLVARTSIVQPGPDEGIVEPPTPWYLTPVAVAIALLVVTVVISIGDWRRRRVTRFYDTVLFFIAGIAGCVIFFVEFISTHEAVMPNYNVLWLHPLLLLPAVLPWIKRARPVLRWCHIVNIVLIASTVVVWVSGLQVPNAAFYPIIASLLLRSIVTLRSKKM